jgi:hypothetical protein
MGKNNAQLIGVLGPFMIESGKTRAETFGAFSVGLTVVAFSVGLTTGISNISFFGSFNNFLV